MSDAERQSKSKRPRDAADIKPTPAYPFHKHFFAPDQTPEQIADALLGVEQNKAP